MARAIVGVLVAIVLGGAIAWLDSRPSWDDTGITVTVLVGAAFVLAAASGRRPWLWAILIGLPTPLVELSAGGNTGSVMALAFAAIGAGAGWLVGRSRVRVGPD